MRTNKIYPLLALWTLNLLHLCEFLIQLLYSHWTAKRSVYLTKLRGLTSLVRLVKIAVLHRVVNLTLGDWCL